jgi:hypothetical protein
MEYVIKRKLNLFGVTNIIKFYYNVKITKNGFENFDIGNEEELIDELINNLDIKNTSYLLVSQYFFKKIKNLNFLEYETEKFISKISRDEYHF